MRPDQVAQVFIQLGPDNLEEWTPHNPSGQPVPLFRCPHREKVFPYIQPKFLGSIYAHCISSSHNTTRRAWLHLFHKLIISTGRLLTGSPQSHLFSRPNKSSSLQRPTPRPPEKLQLPKHASLLNFFPFIMIILVSGVPKARCRCGLMNAESLNLLDMRLIQPRRLLALFAARAHCWFMSSFLPPRPAGHAQQCCSPASQSQFVPLGNQNYRTM